MNKKLKVAGLLSTAAIALSVAGGFAAAAAGTEIVRNGDFNANTSQWATIGEGTLAKSPGQGAVLTNTNDPILASDFWLYQCMNVDSGWERLLTARLNVPEGQERTGSVHYEVRFYEAKGCSGTSMDSDISPSWAFTDGWQDTSLKLWRHNGKDAGSLALVVAVHKNMPQQALKKDLPFFAVIDDISIVETDSGDAQAEPTATPTKTPTKQPQIIPPAPKKTVTATPTQPQSGGGGAPSGGATSTPTAGNPPAGNPVDPPISDDGSGVVPPDYDAGEVPGLPSDYPDENPLIGELQNGDAPEPPADADPSTSSGNPTSTPAAPNTGSSHQGGNAKPAGDSGVEAQLDAQEEGGASPLLFGAVLAAALGTFGFIAAARKRRRQAR